MYWEDQREKKEFQEIEDTFYLDIPEEKIFYPIDLSYEITNGSEISKKNNFKVDIEKGLRKPIEIIEIDFKRNKKNKRKKK
jgi:hypothetical protein